MYYVKYECVDAQGWLGPYSLPASAREARDKIRQGGGYAIVHRSTVATRALVAAWKQSKEV